jgi:hypothetical protein
MNEHALPYGFPPAFGQVFGYPDTVSTAIVDRSAQTQLHAFSKRWTENTSGTTQRKTLFALTQEAPPVAALGGLFFVRPLSIAPKFAELVSDSNYLSISEELNSRHEQARKNLGAVMLLDAWLREAAGRFDESQSQDLAKNKAGLDAERTFRKLFP